MEPIRAPVTVKTARGRQRTQATRVHFSAHRCFALDGGADDARCIALLAQHLLTWGHEVVLQGTGPLARALLQGEPRLARLVRRIIADGAGAPGEICGVPVVTPAAFLAGTRPSKVFSTATRALDLLRARRALGGVEVVAADVLAQLDWQAVPDRAWVATFPSIYPIEVPEIEIQSGLDMILLDCPARNLAMLPNGVGYVHNALKNTGIRFQTVDADIIAYHRFHMHRLLDCGGAIVTADGYRMREDPWVPDAYDEWQKPEVHAYFLPELEEVVAALVGANPRILGLSVHGCNAWFAAAVARKVKAARPEMAIVAGGYSCYQPSIGRRAFPDADYVVIGEADLTIGPLVREILAKGEARHLAGVFSRFDAATHVYVPGPQPNQLDELESPKYEWTDLGLYRNFNDYRLTPVIASRGCRWSRCTFCAERFFWRIRSPKSVVDEFEWFVERGLRHFMFNESDLNGNPELLLAICDEVIRRGLDIELGGQLRIHKKNDRPFFDKLRDAGFAMLRWGVDAWSPSTLKLQKKGYTVDMIRQTLRDCWEAGIWTEVNTVIGIPGETEEDIDQTIALKVELKPFIGRVANINTLLLVVGSVYWEDPARHNIVFHRDQRDLYAEYPRVIPSDLWHSEKPYVDAAIRKARFERVVQALDSAGYDIGAFARQTVNDLRAGRAQDDRERYEPGAPGGLVCEEPPGEPEQWARLHTGGSGGEADRPRAIVAASGSFLAVPTDAPVDGALKVRRHTALESLPQTVYTAASDLLADRKRMEFLTRRALQMLRSRGAGPLFRAVRRFAEKEFRPHVAALRGS